MLLPLTFSPAMAQHAAANREKYDTYRERLRNRFMFYSGDATMQASHLPMECRYRQSDGKEVVYWADGTWWLGHYTALLATEHARLLREGRVADADSTLEELRMALQVYERLDREAEACWGGETAAPNGFYLRDDVPKGMASVFGADVVRSDYALRCGQLQSTSNGPSQDQAWASYMGLALVTQLVGDTSLCRQAAEIACRMVKIMQYTDEKGKTHWEVRNPVNGLLVQKEGDIRWLRYTHARVYSYFSGNSDAMESRFDGADGALARRTWKTIQNNYRIDKNGKFNWYGVLVLSAVLNEKGSGGKSVAEWLVRESKALAKKRPDYAQPLMFPHLPLVNQLLYDSLIPAGHTVRDALEAAVYEQLLDAAPKEGAHRIRLNNNSMDTTAAPWHTLSLFCPWHTESQGEFNMLDYMLLYNLYQLVYPQVPVK